MAAGCIVIRKCKKINFLKNIYIFVYKTNNFNNGGIYTNNKEADN
jgi:hypothetical protein